MPTDNVLDCFQCSFARYMSGSGFDTWILELRGSGLSTLGLDLHDIKQPINGVPKNINSGQQSIVNLYAYADSGISPLEKRETSMQLGTKLTETFIPLSERISSFLNDGWSRKFLKVPLTCIVI